MYGGPPYPAESGYLLPHERGLPRGAIPDTAYATTVAARTSVNPAALGPHTSVTGHGLIAATACGRSLPSPPGALNI